MGARSEGVNKKIESFRKRYYLNIFVKGLILSLSILFSYFLLATVLEHNLWLGTWARSLTFFTFFFIAIYCIFKFLKEPLRWWISSSGLTEEQSAKIIGSYVPTIKDRLLNLIQLAAVKESSPLAHASIEQKSGELEPISFESFIDIKENKRYLKFLLIPSLLIIGVLVFNGNIITKSTDRILHFNRKYAPEAPFKFVIENKNLEAFFNEDFTIKLRLEGNALPESVYTLLNGQRIKMDKTSDGTFTYTFEKIQQPINLQFEAAGFYSPEAFINILIRPELTQFKVELEYPRYLNIKNEQLINAGNLEIPEGTSVKWKLSTLHTQHAYINFGVDSSKNSFQLSDNQTFIYQKSFVDPAIYNINLLNDKSTNKEKITYSIDVIKDQYPQITVNNFKDSILYKNVMVGGIVSDDYGISKLSLRYKILNENDKELLTKTIRIPVNVNQSQQSFFYNWSLDSVRLNHGDQLEYYLEVWDNDGVNGSKSTKTAVYTLMMPTEDDLIAEINNSQNQTEQKIDKSVGKANKIQDQIDQAHQKLKGKQNLDWQDRKMLEDIIQQKQGLDQIVQELKEENKLLEDKKDAFTEQNERIKEKAQQLQKLMDELLDEETKKLFEELQKLLKETNDTNQIQKILDKLNQNTSNLEKELERTLDLFKQLQYEYKLDQAIKDVGSEIDKQKTLLEKTESLEKERKTDKSERKNEQDAKNNKNQNDTPGNDESQELAKEQEKLNNEFKETSEKMEDLKKIKEELNKNDELPSEEQIQEIQEQQEESEQNLKENQPSKSKAPQKQALKKMQEMQQQMQSAQESMSMEMEMQNLESLRQIIHGLVKLSFDQETLMKQFSELNQSDPRFNVIAQQEIKLKDDAQVLEDSLLALGKKDPFMGSIVTKEVGELNNHIDKVIEANKERRRPQASSEMQASMTSINNLALMLDDHFDMMMQMMANAQPSMGKSKQKGQKPSLSQMQQQLNQRIQELKNGGKSGRQLSEELAAMAAEQERIRKALQEMQEKMKDGGQSPGGQIPSKMEQTEMDLVNKQLTDQLIKRQQEILTRLLETERSAREQDMDKERKGETAKEYDKEIPKAFEEYLRLKEKEVELLKTVPPKLFPYYKKEVSDYFKRMAN